MKKFVLGITILIVSMLSPGWAKPAQKQGKGGGSTSIPMETTHYAGENIQPDTGVDSTYDSNTPGTTVTLNGTTYNMVQQCPMDSDLCTQGFNVYLEPSTSNPAGCPTTPIALPRARLTLWVNNLLECQPAELDPLVACGSTYPSTARAQIRELDEVGGVLEGGFGTELNWDTDLGGSDINITANDGSWDIAGASAVSITGKGKNKLTCSYDASFRLTTSPVF
ncbi:MAG: hypothetical protein JSU96_12390 [Acidobacteriota bacterium]|nr:MAG: hypothetical protein JSU96_12390 [Acidobacteriota bacterium]